MCGAYGQEIDKKSSKCQKWQNNRLEELSLYEKTAWCLGVLGIEFCEKVVFFLMYYLGIDPFLFSIGILIPVQAPVI